MDNFQFTLSQALKATELGLRTCWMALTFKGSDFIKALKCLPTSRCA